MKQSNTLRTIRMRSQRLVGASRNKQQCGPGGYNIQQKQKQHFVEFEVVLRDRDSPFHRLCKL